MVCIVEKTGAGDVSLGSGGARQWPGAWPGAQGSECVYYMHRLCNHQRCEKMTRFRGDSGERAIGAEQKQSDEHTLKGTRKENPLRPT